MKDPWQELASFAVVGVVGFIVDAALFLLMTGYFAVGPLWARALSATCSITSTWVLNRHITFSKQKSAELRSEYLKYAVTQSAGFAINLGIFGLCVVAVPFFRTFPILALVVGAIVAFGFNFYTARSFAFAKRSTR